jgi:hypothetical protein
MAVQLLLGKRLSECHSSRFAPTSARRACNMHDGPGKMQAERKPFHPP